MLKVQMAEHQEALDRKSGEIENSQMQTQRLKRQICDLDKLVCAASQGGDTAKQDDVSSECQEVFINKCLLMFSDQASRSQYGLMMNANCLNLCIAQA